MIVLLFLFCLPLLSILFLKTKRNYLARPVMGTIFLVIHTENTRYEIACLVMGTIFLVISVCVCVRACMFVYCTTKIIMHARNKNVINFYSGKTCRYDKDNVLHW